MTRKPLSSLNEPSLARGLLVIAALVIILAGMKIAQPILVPFLMAAFLAVLTSPAVRWLVEHKVPASVAIGGVVFLVFGVMYGIGSLVAASADELLQRLPEYERQLDEWVGQFRARAPWLADDVRNSLQSLTLPDSFISFAGKLFSGLGSILLATVLTLFILVFMLFEAQGVQRKLHRALGDNHSVEYAHRFTRSVQRYLVIKSLVSALTGIIVWGFLKVMKVDYPILWGTFAFLMNFIPNVGSLIAAIPAIALATFQQGVPGLVISTAGYSVINAVIGNLLEPRLMGRTLDLSTLVVFVSLIFWGWILGPVGTLLAVPLTVVVKIGLEVYPKTRWIAILLSQ